MSQNQRIIREQKTLQKMIALYCQKNHHSPKGQLCADCRSLEAYALERIARCPYGVSKPTCAACPIHCYRPQAREAIRHVMRFAGPRMLFHHPILTLLHLVDSLRYPPVKHS